MKLIDWLILSKDGGDDFVLNALLCAAEDGNHTNLKQLLQTIPLDVNRSNKVSGFIYFLSRFFSSCFFFYLIPYGLDTYIGIFCFIYYFSFYSYTTVSKSFIIFIFIYLYIISFIIIGTKNIYKITTSKLSLLFFFIITIIDFDIKRELILSRTLRFKIFLNNFLSQLLELKKKSR